MRMITTLLLAFVAVAPAMAQKKPDPYLECKKSGRSEQDCLQYMDPHLRKAREMREETARKQMESLRRNEQQDEQWRRQVQQGR